MGWRIEVIQDTIMGGGKGGKHLHTQEEDHE